MPMLKKQITRARWWKFERYILRDHCVVPAPEATLIEYNPWASYSHLEGAYRTAYVAYQELLELYQCLSFLPKSTLTQLHGPPTPDAELQILRWCNTHGLLGVLSQRASQITPEPVRASMDADGKCVELTRRTYVRLGGTWKEFSLLEKQTERDSQPGARGNTGDSVEWEPGVSLHVYGWPLTGVRPIDTLVGRFFPSVPKGERHSFQYPCPNSPEFWEIYAESTNDIVFAAEEFWDHISALSGEGDITGLNQLASSIGLERETAGGQVSVRMAAPSLLAYYAEMALRDAEMGRKVRRCITCGSIFVSNDRQPTYCSARCRSRMQRRRQRGSDLALYHERPHLEPTVPKHCGVMIVIN